MHKHKYQTLPNHSQKEDHSKDSCCGHKHSDHSHCHHDHSEHRQAQPSHCNHNHSKDQEECSDTVVSNGITFTCLLENLGCANCAAKMESQIAQLPGVLDATLTFATRQLRVFVNSDATENEQALISEIQKYALLLNQK